MVWFWCVVVWPMAWPGPLYINCYQTGASFTLCIVYFIVCVCDQIAAEKKVKTVCFTCKRDNNNNKKWTKSQLLWNEHGVNGECAYVVKMKSEIGSPIGIYHCTNNIWSYFCSNTITFYTHLNACCTSNRIKYSVDFQFFFGYTHSSCRPRFRGP